MRWFAKTTICYTSAQWSKVPSISQKLASEIKVAELSFSVEISITPFSACSGQRHAKGKFRRNWRHQTWNRRRNLPFFAQHAHGSWFRFPKRSCLWPGRLSAFHELISLIFLMFNPLWVEVVEFLLVHILSLCFILVSLQAEIWHKMKISNLPR